MNEREELRSFIMENFLPEEEELQELSDKGKSRVDIASAIGTTAAGAALYKAGSTLAKGPKTKAGRKHLKRVLKGMPYTREFKKVYRGAARSSKAVGAATVLGGAAYLAKKAYDKRKAKK